MNGENFQWRLTHPDERFVITCEEMSLWERIKLRFRGWSVRRLKE